MAMQDYKLRKSNLLLKELDTKSCYQISTLSNSVFSYLKLQSLFQTDYHPASQMGQEKPAWIKITFTIARMMLKFL